MVEMHSNSKTKRNKVRVLPLFAVAARFVCVLLLGGDTFSGSKDTPQDSTDGETRSD